MTFNNKLISHGLGRLLLTILPLRFCPFIGPSRLPRRSEGIAGAVKWISPPVGGHGLFSGKYAMKNPILSLPLVAVMREEIALPLRALNIYTVGGLLKAWRSPRNQKHIEM